MEGMMLAREIELRFRERGVNAHVALAGSVLHEGSSEKDLDLIIYPHKTDEGFYFADLLIWMQNQGFN